MKFNKVYLTLGILSIILVLYMACYKNSLPKTIENSSQVTILYTISSHIAILTDQKEIKKLENLFNDAEFEKSDTAMVPEYISVSFYGEKGITRSRIDYNDVIKLSDDSHVKSKQISFGELYSIFRDYSAKKK